MMATTAGESRPEDKVSVEPVFDRRHPGAPLKLVGWRRVDPLPWVRSPIEAAADALNLADEIVKMADRF